MVSAIFFFLSSTLSAHFHVHIRAALVLYKTRAPVLLRFLHTYIYPQKKKKKNGSASASEGTFINSKNAIVYHMKNSILSCRFIIITIFPWQIPIKKEEKKIRSQARIINWSSLIEWRNSLYPTGKLFSLCARYISNGIKHSRRGE